MGERKRDIPFRFFNSSFSILQKLKVRQQDSMTTFLLHNTHICIAEECSNWWEVKKIEVKKKAVALAHYLHSAYSRISRAKCISFRKIAMLFQSFKEEFDSTRSLLGFGVDCISIFAGICFGVIHLHGFGIFGIGIGILLGLWRDWYIFLKEDLRLHRIFVKTRGVRDGWERNISTEDKDALFEDMLESKV